MKRVFILFALMATLATAVALSLAGPALASITPVVLGHNHASSTTTVQLGGGSFNWSSGDDILLIFSAKNGGSVDPSISSLTCEYTTGLPAPNDVVQVPSTEITGYPGTLGVNQYDQLGSVHGSVFIWELKPDETVSQPQAGDCTVTFAASESAVDTSVVDIGAGRITSSTYHNSNNAPTSLSMAVSANAGATILNIVTHEANEGATLLSPYDNVLSSDTGSGNDSQVVGYGTYASSTSVGGSWSTGAPAIAYGLIIE